MFSKKVSLFVCSFLSLMLITNLFAIPVYGEDLPYTENGVEVNNGELIYLIAQANGIKLKSANSSNLFDVLYNSYNTFKSYTPNIVDDLKGFIVKGINGYLNVSKNVYNSVVRFLRERLYLYRLPSSSSINLYPINSQVEFSRVWGDYSFNGKLDDGSFYYSMTSVGNDRNWSKIKCYKDGNFVCTFESSSPVYTVSLGGDAYFVSQHPTVLTIKGIDNRNRPVVLPITLNRESNAYDSIVYYTTAFASEYPVYYLGSGSITNSSSVSSFNLLFKSLPSEIKFIFSNDFDVNNIHSSSSNVTITNIYFNETTNNITINNNGTQVPIDDNVQSDVIAPTVPDVKPYNVVIDLNDIDTIQNYHNDVDQNINDFLIQFNDNLNKIDTNCYSLSSCAINGLKSVGNAVNDITGYSDKGMNSEFVLLICLFLLLGILFTIL